MFASAIRLFFAVCLGYLAQEVLVFTAGVAAARATPAGYFEYFGRQQLEVALGLWSLATFAIPQFITGALLAWAALRLLHRRQPLAHAFLAGTLLCWLRYMLSVPSQDGTSMQLATNGQFWSLVHAIYIQNMWHLPAAWATWLGLTAGVLFACKNGNHTTAPRAEA